MISTLPHLNFVTIAQALPPWRDTLFSGRPPELFRVGTGELARVEIGPGLVTLLGGPPGAGKTALAMQWIVDALRHDTSLRALVCNVEMSIPSLLDRQLSRLCGVSASAVRRRSFGADDRERIDRGVATLNQIAERLAFLKSPFDLGHAVRAAEAIDARLILLDYIQRIRPYTGAGAGAGSMTQRGSVDATMSQVRQIAEAGAAVVVISAVGRSKDDRGRSSYSGRDLGLASFRESSELEYGADDAYLIHGADDVHEVSGPKHVTLRHLKSRHGETGDLELEFDAEFQSFTAAAQDADQHGTGNTPRNGPDGVNSASPVGSPEPAEVQGRQVTDSARDRSLHSLEPSVAENSLIAAHRAMINLIQSRWDQTAAAARPSTRRRERRP